MSTELQLVSHKLCPYVQRAVIALAEKQVPFERIDIDLANKPDWFKTISPLGKVPVLRIGGGGREMVLFESNVICEYIEEAFGGPKLHPDVLPERARHRAWMEFGSAILADVWGVETANEATLFDSKRAAVAAKFTHVEAALGAGPYFAGETFSLVDAVFAPIFRYFDVFDKIVDLGVFVATPKVLMWRARLAERPSVRGAVGEDYPELLYAFLMRHDAHLLRLAA